MTSRPSARTSPLSTRSRGEGGAHASRREAEDGVGRPEGRDDLLVRDHDPGAKPRQPELRQAHAKHRVFVPGKRRVAEDDAGEGQPVGVVHDERHAAGAGDGAEALDLRVGHHVSGRVGGPRDADRADVLDRVERLEVHPVLEQHVPEVGDGRAARDEEIGREAEVGIADVLGRERQEDAARSPVAVRPREQVEQGEERGLAAVGDGDVALAHLPALLAPQELREGAGEAPIPRRSVIVPDRPLERAVALHERLHPHPEDPLRGRDVARIPAAEVDDPAARGHRFAEVVHEQARARLAGQPPAECRKLHVREGVDRADVGLMFMPPRYHAVVSSSSSGACMQRHRPACSIGIPLASMNARAATDQGSYTVSLLFGRLGRARNVVSSRRRIVAPTPLLSGSVSGLAADP